jgi:DUF1680 family protein
MSAPAPPGARPDYPIRAVPLDKVHLTDDFWRPRLERNRTVTIPHIMRQNETTGRVDNFRKAAHTLAGPYQGQRYNDTDIYKVVEAASYVLQASRDPVLERQLDDLIALIAAAQEPDGYIYAARTVDPRNPAPGAGPDRWTWLHTSHELYDQGHLYEAAVAHFAATGKRSLLDVAIKSADLVCRTFGPHGHHDVPGHEEIELALVKLYRATGQQRYLDTARFFLAERGRPHSPAPVQFEAGNRFAIYNDLAYRQDHEPLAQQKRAVGHAVRAMYLYTAMTDAAALMNDRVLALNSTALWNDVVSKRMYVTGGLGSEGRTEAFGDDYALPNRAYAETCASVGGLLWYHRMFLRSGDAKYYDTFERTLYNGYLSGVSIYGDTFFYQNPLESDGTRERTAYFDVACCPANLSRLMAQLPGLVYARTDRNVFVNLFIGSDASLDVGSTTVRLSQQTRYPWDGHVAIAVNPQRPVNLTLSIRVPGWSRGAAMPSDLYRFSGPTRAGRTGGRRGQLGQPGQPAQPAQGPAERARLRVNGLAVPMTVVNGYARLQRRWIAGDTVELDLPMPVRRLLAHERVEEDRGKAAIERGPIVYCVEDIDNAGHVADVRLSLDTELQHYFDRTLLGGVEVIHGGSVVAVPYYAWANRGKGRMAVWIPYRSGG